MVAAGTKMGKSIGEVISISLALLLCLTAVNASAVGASIDGSARNGARPGEPIELTMDEVLGLEWVEATQRLLIWNESELEVRDAAGAVVANHSIRGVPVRIYVFGELVGLLFSDPAVLSVLDTSTNVFEPDVSLGFTEAYDVAFDDDVIVVDGRTDPSSSRSYRNQLDRQGTLTTGSYGVHYSKRLQILDEETNSLLSGSLILMQDETIVALDSDDFSPRASAVGNDRGTIWQVGVNDFRSLDAVTLAETFRYTTGRNDRRDDLLVVEGEHPTFYLRTSWRPNSSQGLDFEQYWWNGTELVKRVIRPRATQYYYATVSQDSIFMIGDLWRGAHSDFDEADGLILEILDHDFDSRRTLTIEVLSHGVPSSEVAPLRAQCGDYLQYPSPTLRYNVPYDLEIADAEYCEVSAFEDHGTRSRVVIPSDSGNSTIDASSRRWSGLLDYDQEVLAIDFYPSAYTDFDLFVEEQFQLVLGRSPTGTEVYYWADQFNTYGRQYESIAGDLLESTEYKQLAQPMTRLYLAYFRRRPDPDGYAYWLATSRAGSSLDNISAYFEQSEEFVLTYGQLSNRGFVELVYRNIMERTGEQSGVDYWTSLLDAGTLSRGQMMVQFSESVEYRLKTNSEIAVYDLVKGELEVVPAGLDFGYWTRRYEQRGRLDDLARTLIDSDAYYNKFFWSSTGSVSVVGLDRHAANEPTGALGLRDDFEAPRAEEES